MSKLFIINGLLLTTMLTACDGTPKKEGATPTGNPASGSSTRTGGNSTGIGNSTGGSSSNRDGVTHGSGSSSHNSTSSPPKVQKDVIKAKILHGNKFSTNIDDYTEIINDIIPITTESDFETHVLNGDIRNFLPMKDIFESINQTKAIADDKITTNDLFIKYCIKSGIKMPDIIKDYKKTDLTQGIPKFAKEVNDQTLSNVNVPAGTFGVGRIGLTTDDFRIQNIFTFYNIYWFLENLKKYSVISSYNIIPPHTGVFGGMAISITL